ncbi:hypothetical protein SAMN05421505_1142 [Sinosporangium album]|uniref:Uncharacterized protein n=1 Tax=Sinosporangium album TaxID=504805 RepID=A0A1G8BCB7_9ACTN|nr:hypothetical protein [Sinosporangium album]SDH30877.1 hypothetical protein SAMN05421505_1142 [Sinosporangium album]
MIICYLVAAGAFLLTAGSPLPRGRHRIALWTGALAASAWTVVTSRLPDPTDGFIVGVAGNELPASPWDTMAWWFLDAERTGLPLVIVALAATAHGTFSDLPGRLTVAATAAALLFFALLDVVAHADRYGGDLFAYATSLVRWPLLLSAVLITMAGRTRRMSTSPTGAVGSAPAGIPWRPKEIAIAVVVAFGVVWLVVSSFAPS